MKIIFLIVGLGNPGPEYALTRHNIGFLAIDAIARHYKTPSYQEKYHGLMTRMSYTLPKGDACEIILLKPLTYMNVSGRSVQAAMQFYKIPLHRVIVIHDDLDLEPGDIRVKIGGGHGGHNGLKSIDQSIGKDYLRVRLGIGHPGHRDLVSPYVLGTFPKSDHRWLEPLLWTLGEHIPQLCESCVTSSPNGKLPLEATQWLSQVSQNAKI